MLSKYAGIIATVVLAALPAPALTDGFILVAHRGVVDETFTENGLPSLEEAIRRGYTHVEVDIRSTKDGVPG